MSTVSLKAVALRYLAQREHSRVELERKLRRHLSRVSRANAAGGKEAHTATDAVVFSAADEAAARDADATGRITAALDALALSGLLSDERTAASVLRSQGQRYGALRIKHTLQAKGLSADLVADTVASARETELQRAQAVWARRFGTPALAPKDRAQQMRFLAQRGFDAQTVARVVRQAAGSLRADDEVASQAWPEGSDTAGFTKKRRLAPDSDPNTPL